MFSVARRKIGMIKSWHKLRKGDWAKRQQTLLSRIWRTICRTEITHCYYNKCPKAKIYHWRTVLLNQQFHNLYAKMHSLFRLLKYNIPLFNFSKVVWSIVIVSMVIGSSFIFSGICFLIRNVVVVLGIVVAVCAIVDVAVVMNWFMSCVARRRSMGNADSVVVMVSGSS